MKECQMCKNCYADEVETCPQDGMPTMHTIPGEPVLEGKYQLEHRLGQGGMGVVYKARHAFLKTQLAIKIILPDLVGNDPQLVTRFRQEALAAAAIRHTNVVGVTDYGVISGSIPFLVMEYVEGESLHDLLTREKILSPERALDLMSAIAAGVGAAHHQGIVHRDLKPLNIMICSDKPSMSQAVKILDFGLAKIKSGELLGSFVQAKTTGLMGSPYYMAPEQWADDEPDAGSDIYSLGVMLFQMLTGDVPFKGSSIPAIMKKHISDTPPTFAEMGVTLPVEVEQVVRHTLVKDKEQRTDSVERLIGELRSAVFPQQTGNLNTTQNSISTFAGALNIRTNPPRSAVYVDGQAVGQTREDGWITLNGLQTGNHRLHISKAGYQDWASDVAFDGNPKQVLAELQPIDGSGSDAETVAFNTSGRSQTFSATQNAQNEMQQTGTRQWNDTGQPAGVAAIAPRRSSFSKFIIGGLIALIALSVLGGLGVGGAYLSGVFNRGAVEPTPGGTNSTPVANSSPTTTGTSIADMAKIPGGQFTMGSNTEKDNAKPEHQITVNTFWMDKTEVTNGEYYEFVKATGYKAAAPHVNHWVNNKPIAGQETFPVRFVNADDIKAFADWRAKRDGVAYRLPTEQEWEYAARNGSKDTLYPWGNTFEEKCAMLNQTSNEPAPVGRHSCPNEWGVQDLIGNVFEWTSSPASLYPGSTGAVAPMSEPHLMVRGGSAFQKSTGPNSINSTFRIAIPASKRSTELGFRLVKAE